jgi:hypothetical protein
MTETAGVSDRVPRRVLLDASGRKVLDLTPGPNDASRLAPGVYFVCDRPQASSPKPQAAGSSEGHHSPVEHALPRLRHRDPARRPEPTPRHRALRDTELRTDSSLRRNVRCNTHLGIRHGLGLGPQRRLRPPLHYLGTLNRIPMLVKYHLVRLPTNSRRQCRFAGTASREPMRFLDLPSSFSIMTR